MAKILIPTIQDDIHAAAVAHVLAERGHVPIRWFCGDVPSAATASLAIGDDEPMACELRGGELCGSKLGGGELGGSKLSVSLDDIDVFWNRRVADPILRDQLVPADREFAAREAKRFVRGLLMSISQRVFSVNDYHRAAAAENKVVQLAAAREVGFAIPRTLISNDPARIRRFVDRCAGTGAICKSFRPVTWEGDDQVAILYTSRVDAELLPRDPILQLGTAIFQECLAKSCEIRVTAMGAELFAARLDSQASGPGALDWRLAEYRDLAIDPIELPADIARKCRALLDRLGLVFGCFDFVVTPAGDYVFLEINQMGQFLWVEDGNPQFPLLEAFCDFLVSRDPQFRYTAPPRPVAMHEINDLAIAMIERDRRVHVQPERYRHIVRE